MNDKGKHCGVYWTSLNRSISSWQLRSFVVRKQANRPLENLRNGICSHQIAYYFLNFLKGRFYSAFM